MQFDLSGLSDCKILRGDYLWPNELSLFKDTRSGTKVMLIPDGFLMPGQNNGGDIVSAIQVVFPEFFLKLFFHSLDERCLCDERPSYSGQWKLSSYSDNPSQAGLVLSPCGTCEVTGRARRHPHGSCAKGCFR